MGNNKRELMHPLSQDVTVSPSLSCDPVKYQMYLDDSDLSEEARTEVLLALWSIMASFVDMGFGVDSIQFLPKDNTSPDDEVLLVEVSQGTEGEST